MAKTQLIITIIIVRFTINVCESKAQDSDNSEGSWIFMMSLRADILNMVISSTVSTGGSAHLLFRPVCSQSEENKNNLFQEVDNLRVFTHNSI